MALNKADAPMTKKFLVVVIVCLSIFGGIMTYVAWNQGVLLDRIIRCAASSSLMEA